MEINIFGFIEIFGVRVHLWSLIAMVTTFFIGCYLLRRIKKIPLIYNILISTVIVQFGNHSYEMIWITIIGHNPIAYILSMCFILFILLLLNYKFRFFSFKPVFVYLVIIQIIVYLILYLSGHYKAIKLWMYSGGPDPHNYLWLLNKGLGFWIWLGVVRTNIE